LQRCEKILQRPKNADPVRAIRTVSTNFRSSIVEGTKWLVC